MIWDGNIDDCMHQNHVFRARADRARLNPRFLAYAITARPARDHFRSSAKTTSGLSTINSTQTRALPIPLPPVREQESIAAQLDVVRDAAVIAHSMWRHTTDLRTALLESLLSGERRVRMPEVAAA